MADLIEARARDCACPGTPHEDGDVVYLRPTLGIEGGLEAEADLLEAIQQFPIPERMSKREEDAATTARGRFLRPKWFVTFLRHGAVGWNLVDAEGDDVPFDVERLVADYSLARMPGDKAADLYGPAVLAPFQSPPPKHSRNGRTAGGTHPPSTPTPLRSRRSSPRVSDGQQSEATA